LRPWWTSPDEVQPSTTLHRRCDAAPADVHARRQQRSSPTKLGFKNPKHVIGITVLDRCPGGYWEDQGYNWFSGL